MSSHENVTQEEPLSLIDDLVAFTKADARWLNKANTVGVSNRTLPLASF